MGITITQYRISIGTFCGKEGKNSLIFPHELSREFIGIEVNGCFSNWGLWTRRQWANCLSKSSNMCSIFSSRSKICSLIGGCILLHMSIILLCSGDIHPNPGPGRVKDISIVHANIRSLRRNYVTKLDEIRCTLADDYDIIILSETWLNSSVASNVLNLQDFQPPFRRDRPDDSGYGGGIGLGISGTSCQEAPVP